MMMPKPLRFITDGLFLALFLGLLVLPISSIGLSTYRTSSSGVLGIEEPSSSRHYQVRVVGGVDDDFTPQTSMPQSPEEEDR